MKNVVVTVIGLAMLLGLGIWWEVYKYQDCLRVGHSKTYCIFNIGGK